MTLLRRSWVISRARGCQPQCTILAPQPRSHIAVRVIFLPLVALSTYLGAKHSTILDNQQGGACNKQPRHSIAREHWEAVIRDEAPRDHRNTGFLRDPCRLLSAHSPGSSGDRRARRPEHRWVGSPTRACLHLVSMPDSAAAGKTERSSTFWHSCCDLYIHR